MQDFYKNLRAATDRTSEAMATTARVGREAVGKAVETAASLTPFALVGRGVDALFKGVSDLRNTGGRVTQSGAGPSASGLVNSINQRLASRKEDRASKVAEGTSVKPNDVVTAGEQTLEEATQPGKAAYDTDTDTIYYTYKPGDTFGQVLVNLGLVSDRGLWGQGGDVDFYTQQLLEQNVLDNRGNIPIGTTIRLQRRK